MQSDTKLRFFTNAYAPGMVQCLITDQIFLSQVLEIVAKNSGTPAPESTALLSYEDFLEQASCYGLTQQQIQEIQQGFPVEVTVDSWLAASLYGYSAADDLLHSQ